MMIQGMSRANMQRLYDMESDYKAGMRLSGQDPSSPGSLPPPSSWRRGNPVGEEPNPPYSVGNRVYDAQGSAHTAQESRPEWAHSLPALPSSMTRSSAMAMRSYRNVNELRSALYPTHHEQRGIRRSRSNFEAGAYDTRRLGSMEHNSDAQGEQLGGESPVYSRGQAPTAGYGGSSVYRGTLPPMKFRRVSEEDSPVESADARLRFPMRRFQQEQERYVFERLQEEHQRRHWVHKGDSRHSPMFRSRVEASSAMASPRIYRNGASEEMRAIRAPLTDEPIMPFAIGANGHVHPRPQQSPDLSMMLPPPLPSTTRRFASSSPRPLLRNASRLESLAPIDLREPDKHTTQPAQPTMPLLKPVPLENDTPVPSVLSDVNQRSSGPPLVPEFASPEPDTNKDSHEKATRSASSSQPTTVETRTASKASPERAQHAAAPTASSEPKRRCGRKSMNYSSEQKRERNRAAVKKCRQRQALKYDYLLRKAEVLATENQALSELLAKNVELDDEKRQSLTRGIQMDILLKIKEIFTQSLPKDFVIDADSIWDLNSVLAVSMPSRCYYGIESIKDFWRTSLRMRNKGKIRSFWAWLFRLPPGDRFSEFSIEPFSATSNLYFVNWTTKSTPPLSGSMVILFGQGHRVTLHVECFGWLIWRYLLTNEPFPEPPME